MSMLMALVYTLMISRIILDSAKAVKNIHRNNKIIKDLDESIELCATPHRQKHLAEAILGKRQIQGA